MLVVMLVSSSVPHVLHQHPHELILCRSLRDVEGKLASMGAHHLSEVACIIR
jgi:hypothetical protein